MTTTQCQCVVCGKQETPAFACYDCGQRLRGMLQEIPELYILSSLEYWPTGAGTTGRSPERTLGLRVAALDGRNPVDAIEKLESWERLLREEFTPTQNSDLSQRKRKAERWADSDSDDHSGVTLCGVVDWLVTNLDRICAAFPAVDEFATEVREIHRDARVAARITSEPATVVECPADHPDNPGRLCGKKLRLVQDQADCPRCGTSWDYGRLLVVARATSAEVWVAAGVISEQLGIPPNTLNRWAREGRVRRRGTTYLWSSVLTIRDELRGTA